MKEQSGRSLIEIIGVLAIGTIMIVAAYRVYNTIDNRQKRMIASDTLEDVAKKTKLLYEMSGYPSTLSVAKLVSDGALSNSKTPIGSSWSVSSIDDGKKFQISVSGLSYDECEYFKLKKTDWATSISSSPRTCTKNKTHTVTFTVQ